MRTHRVTFEMDYVEQRSRLTTFLRLVLAIPHYVVLYFYGIAAGVVVIIAWFALLFTGRWPQGMYDFVAGFLRYATYVYGYVALATDRYPPFSGSPDAGYPVRLNIPPPKPRYDRLKVAFRIILAIPVLIIAYAMQVVYQVGSFIAWFAIVILGRQPKGLQDMIRLGLSYQQRAYAYLLLITEDWPSFTDEQDALTAARDSYQGIPAPANAVSPPPGAAGSPRPGQPGAPHTAPGGEPWQPPDPRERRD
jgi:Domain of unknown function (DUF4389)